MIASQSRSWCSAGSTCIERTPGGRALRAATRTPPVLAASQRAVVGRPFDLRELLHGKQSVLRFLEEHHRVHERAHRLEDRVEHVDAHEAALLRGIVVEVL